VAVTRYFVGLDLGQAQDFTALAVLTRPVVHRYEVDADRKPAYAVPHLHRFPLGTPYPEVVAGVVELLRTPPLRQPMLVVDQTGGWWWTRPGSAGRWWTCSRTRLGGG
jgi:hypothetical protein